MLPEFKLGLLPELCAADAATVSSNAPRVLSTMDIAAISALRRAAAAAAAAEVEEEEEDAAAAALVDAGEPPWLWAAIRASKPPVTALVSLPMRAAFGMAPAVDDKEVGRCCCTGC